MASSRFWGELSTRELAQRRRSGELARTVAVLPLAATEQHGPHLPLNVDTVLADGIIEASLPHLPPELPVLFLPTLAVGLSPEHARFAGTLSLRPETVLRLWTEVAESVLDAGVRKLVLFNTHGGNVGAMDLVGRDLRARRGALVYGVSWFNLPLVDPDGHDLSLAFGADELRFGVHAGAIETAMMLALAPSLVDSAQIQTWVSSAQARAAQFDILGNGRSAKLAWQTQDYHPSGAVGDATLADATTGRALVDAAARSLVRLLVQVSKLPPETLRDTTAYD
ncbi:MAG: creatininase family protein [Rhodoferax sp.]